MTFFNGKDAIFAIKDATCKKCEKSLANTPRVNLLDFWGDFAHECAISAYPQCRRLYAGLYLAHVSTKARSVKVKFVVMK